MANNKPKDRYYYECQCHSDEHRVVWCLEDAYKDWEPMLSFSVFLGNSHIRGKERRKLAERYVKGYKCKYGHFDCFLLRPDDINEMISMLKEFKKKHSNWKRKMPTIRKKPMSRT